MLRAGDFGGVHAAINVDENFAFASEFMRGSIVKAARPGEAAVSVLVFVEGREIFRRGNEGNSPIETARGLADIDEFYAIRRLRELLEVSPGFIVVGKIEIVAGSVAENRRRSGNG